MKKIITILALIASTSSFANQSDLLGYYEGVLDDGTMCYVHLPANNSGIVGFGYSDEGYNFGVSAGELKRALREKSPIIFETTIGTDAKLKLFVENGELIKATMKIGRLRTKECLNLTKEI